MDPPIFPFERGFLGCLFLPRAPFKTNQQLNHQAEHESKGSKTHQTNRPPRLIVFDGTQSHSRNRPPSRFNQSTNQPINHQADNTKDKSFGCEELRSRLIKQINCYTENTKARVSVKITVNQQINHSTNQPINHQAENSKGFRQNRPPNKSSACASLFPCFFLGGISRLRLWALLFSSFFWACAVPDIFGHVVLLFFWGGEAMFPLFFFGGGRPCFICASGKYKFLLTLPGSSNFWVHPKSVAFLRA